VDWEAIGTDDDGHLIIGDFGNNLSYRRDLAIYVVNEPCPYAELKTPVLHKIRFYYPDQEGFPFTEGNFDAEALWWSNGKTYLLTKHHNETYTRLYRLDSIDLETENPLTFLDAFDVGGMVSAADITSDGKMLAVLTYSAIWVFEVCENSDDYFKGKIRWLPISARQCEGIAFDGDHIVLTNEERDVFQVPLSDLTPVRR